MASNREERFQMRQRGAGTHKIKDISFALAFPTADEPLQPQRSSRSRRTPQPEQQPLRPQRSTRRTPQPAQQPLLHQRSSRRTPGPAAKAKATPDNANRTDDTAKESVSKATRSSSQGSVSKKQQLTGPSPAQATSTANDIPSSSTRSRSGVGNGTVVSQAAEPLDVGSSVVSDRRRSLRSRSSLDSVLVGSQEAKVGEASAGRQKAVERGSALDSGIQKNKPGITTTASRSKSAPKNTAHTKGKQSVGRGATRPQRSKSATTLRQEKSSSTQSPEAQPEEVIEDEGSEPQKRGRGRPRKSLPTVDEEEEAVDAPPKKPPPASTKSRPQTSKTTGTAKSSNTAKPFTARRTRSTPTQSTRSRTSDISDASTIVRRPSAKDTVPITVHRLSQPQALKNGASSADQSAGAPTFIKRNGVNPIDVLAQICKELIATSAETLQRSVAADNEMRRGEATRKRKAVEAFGVALEERLFDMTEALDNNYALSARLKQANKEKIALREDFLRIRDERQKVALRMDEVRRVHSQEAKAFEERNDLNTAFSDIELAVERGRAAQQAAGNPDEGDENGGLKPAGIELLLRNVTAIVSSSSDGGGLLNQVKEFNGFLERVAAVLENRA